MKIEREKIQIKRPDHIRDLLEKWSKKRQENFLVITLDSSHYVIHIHHISKGIVNRTIVHPRECFYPAIKDNACAVIFAHNHTSGHVVPSPEDDEINRRLVLAAEILGFHVLDNLIIAKNGLFYSYRVDNKKEIEKEYDENDELDYVKLLVAERKRREEQYGLDI